MKIDVESLVHTDDVQEIRLTKVEDGYYLVTIIRVGGARVLATTSSRYDLEGAANSVIEKWALKDWEL